ncbi:MAG: polysaccharide deacetylase family protein [Armatimonadota bacterium]
MIHNNKKNSQPNNIIDTCGGMSVTLLYHRMGFPKFSSLVAGQYVAPIIFEKQLAYFEKNGWQSVPLEKIKNTSQDFCIEHNRLAITFDDGYLSVYKHAIPILKKQNYNATIFVVANTIGGINEWDKAVGDKTEKMMTRAQIREICNMGFEIGSHTLSHAHLLTLSDKEAFEEITASKNKLEDIIGKEVKSFSYPYGEYGEREVQYVKSAGYKYAVSTKKGIVLPQSDIFEIPRINVRWSSIPSLLMKKIKNAASDSSRKG